MAQRRRFSAEYKREAVAMLNAPGLTVSQIATELGVARVTKNQDFLKRAALQHHQPTPSLLHQSDRESQYAATAYRQHLRARA